MTEQTERQERQYSVIAGRAHVMTVWATSEDEAREIAREQLQKPGRWQIAKQWRETGEQVKEL